MLKSPRTNGGGFNLLAYYVCVFVRGRKVSRYFPDRDTVGETHPLLHKEGFIRCRQLVKNMAISFQATPQWVLGIETKTDMVAVLLLCKVGRSAGNRGEPL